MIQDAKSLLHMSQQELDDLYRASQPGPVPAGKAEGTAIVVPRTMFGALATQLIRWFVWRGKVFNPAGGDLKNRMTPFEFKAIRAKVYVGDSWLADGSAIVIDYSKTSLVARMVRDEIRQVGPDVYLGKVFLGRKHVIDFSLAFQPQNV